MIMMASSRNYKLLCLIISFALTLIIFVSFTHVSPPDSGVVINKEAWEEEELRKMVLGSRPPACMNKCMTCRPCEATLVIPPHKDTSIPNYYVFHKSSHREDDSYYLLSWKCRCGNRVYQP